MVVELQKNDGLVVFVFLNKDFVAKKRINPEIFRAGTTTPWLAQVKLLNYANNIHLEKNLRLLVSDYWLNKNFSKLVFRKKKWKRRRYRTRYWRRFAKLRLWKLRSSVKILYKKTEMRRRSIRFLVNLTRTRFFLKKKRWKFKNVCWPRFNYRQIYKNKKSLKKDNDYLPAIFREKRQILFRNYYNLHNLLLQQSIPYFFKGRWMDARLSIAGSTVLRQYQFNILSVQPPRWTSYIHLKSSSFRKMVGYILAAPASRKIGFYYVLLLSQINLALHWHSSYLFAVLLKQLLERKYRVQGSLHLMHELLNRLQLTRYNVTCVKLMVTGSFGKLSRSKSWRLGRINTEVSHSLTQISQQISYTATQVWTIRGVLGLRVWIFW